jgi:hypothetical protein
MTAMRRLSQFLIMEERADEVEKLPNPGAIIADGNFYWAEALKTPVRSITRAASCWQLSIMDVQPADRVQLVQGYMPWQWLNL